MEAFSIFDNKLNNFIFCFKIHSHISLRKTNKKQNIAEMFSGKQMVVNNFQ